MIYAAGEEASQQMIQASPTHDGWYLAAIPIGDCRFAVAIQLGTIAQWLEVGRIEALPVANFLSEMGEAGALPLTPIAQDMASPAPGLWHCTDPAGLLLVPPPARRDDTPMLLAVSFRPIIARETTTPPGDA